MIGVGGAIAGYGIYNIMSNNKTKGVAGLGEMKSKKPRLPIIINGRVIN